jgi:hypothetical protein
MFSTRFTQSQVALLSIIAMLGILAVACGGSSKQQSEQTQTNKHLDGWELVGDQGRCKLYMKCVPLQQQANGCSTVFWSICSNVNGDSGAVSAD